MNVVACLRVCLLVFVVVPGKLLAQANGRQKDNVAFIFTNTCNNKRLRLDTATYTNSFGESFIISKLKYYISNITLQTTDGKVMKEENSYYLLNEEDSASMVFSVHIAPGNYNALSFAVGIDSIKNVSGAQTGALDPLNGMFWTWNSGYIMFKLEGNSPQSKAANNKLEYHIGGFAGENNVVQNIALRFPGNPFDISNETYTRIFINADLDKFWNSTSDISIGKTPACTTPGILAKAISANYAGIFQIVRIVQY